MTSKLPLLLLGVGVSATAAWYFTRDSDVDADADKEFDDYDEYAAEELDLSDLDPSEYAFSEEEFLSGFPASEYGDYGWWWTARAKARRRDRKKRAASRKMTRYKKCMKKKGKGHKRCQKIRGRAEKKLLKAGRLDEKLAARGKVTQVAFDEKGNIRSAVGSTGWNRPPASGRKKAQGSSPAGGGYEEEFVPSATESTAMTPVPSAGLPVPLLAVGGLALFGAVGFGLYKMTSKPKPTRRRRKKPTGRRPVAA
jgi:hypothetical protein